VFKNNMQRSILNNINGRSREALYGKKEEK